MATDELWRLWFEKRSIDVRNALMARFGELVENKAHRMQMHLPKSVTFAELVSAGQVGLIHAIERFDRSRRTRFSTYAPTRIGGAIKDWLREIDWVPRLVRTRKQEPVQMQSLASPIASEGRTMALKDVIPAPAFALDGERVSSEFLGRLCDGFSRAEQLIVVLYYGRKMIMREIGQSLGFSESRVSQLHSRLAPILRVRAREMLEEDRGGGGMGASPRDPHPLFCKEATCSF